MRATADSRARSPVAAEARASGGRAVRAAVMDGHDLDVHGVPPPGRVLVLDARIREMDVLIEVRQIVLASPFFDFVLVAVGMAVVVVAVPITLMQPLLIVAFELVVQHDAIDSRAALLQALRFAFERAIDLNIVFELPLAFNARVERLAVLLIAISMALKQASAISCQGHGVISRLRYSGDLNHALLAQVPQITGSRIERSIAVIAQITTGDHSKRTDRGERP